jgi:hypothetical protein
MNMNHTVFCTCKEQATQGTLMTIEPQSLHAAVGSTVTLNVTVKDSVKLFTWQILMSYNSSILNCTGATYPSDNVFAGQTTVPVTPIIDNTAGSVMDGYSLSGSGHFTGSGILCQLQFKVLTTGTCTISFSTPYGSDTFLLDGDLSIIQATTNNGTFTCP